MDINNHIVGQSVENALDQLVHPAYLRARDLVDVWHEGTKSIYSRKGWKPQESRPDYAGILPGGRFVSFDAKHCAGERYHHPKDRAHQLVDLWNAHEGEALAGILVVNWQRERAWWLVPQPGWSMGTFTPTDLPLEGSPLALRVPAHPDFSEFLPNWLAAAMAAERLS